MDQKESFKSFGKQEVLEKSELLESNKTGIAEENKSVNGNNSYKRKHYLQEYEIEATLEGSKRQKTEFSRDICKKDYYEMLMN